MNVIFRIILLFLFLSVTGQIWGISVAQQQYNAEDVAHSVNEYVYDAAVNLHVCCGNQTIEPQDQDAQDRSFLVFVSNFIVTKGTGRIRQLDEKSLFLENL